MAEPRQLVRRPSWSVRLARTATGTIFIASLAVVVLVWVTVSRPFDPHQRPPVPAIIDAATTRAAAELPAYPGTVVTLTYHAVSDDDHAGSTLTRRLFSQHMAALAAAGYHTVRLADVEQLISHQPVRLPAKSLLLTFDDGTLTDWTTVDPVLKKYHFNAVAFLTTSKIVTAGTPSYYLSTRQLRALRANGRWEFGSHSHALHSAAPVPGDLAPPMSNRILVHGHEESMAGWRSRVGADLAKSQRFFRQVFGRPASAFSYPFGDTGSTGNTPAIATAMPGVLKDAGFGAAFVGENVPTEHVNAISAQSARWTLERIGVRATTSVADLLELIRDAVPVAPPKTLAGLPWLGDLATCRRRRVSLAVTSDTYGTCLLSGVNTSQWVDYTLVTAVRGVSRHASAVISVRDGAGAGHRGRLEIVLGESSLVVREQIGDASRVVLARTRLSPGGAVRRIQILLRRDTADVRAGSAGHLKVVFDRRLHEGGVKFAVAADSGRHTVVYDAPDLITSTT
jgi:poly-beta-1,6-N-acetyl-D-glucosamine N-deacetylase